jgi:hypothetical protein
MRYLLLSVVLFACAPGHTPPETRSPPVDCRRVAAAARTEGQSDSAWNSALQSIYNCPATLGELWLDPPRDSLRQKSLHLISGNVSDRKLFQAVAAVLEDAGRPSWHRLDALAVFLQWADSTAVLALNEAPWRAPNGEVVSVTPTIGFVAPAHTHRRLGRFPLGLQERREILGLIRRVAEEDPSITVRAVAQYVDGRLGGLPPRSGWR